MDKKDQDHKKDQDQDSEDNKKDQDSEDNEDTDEKEYKDIMEKKEYKDMNTKEDKEVNKKDVDKKDQDSNNQDNKQRNKRGSPSRRTSFSAAATACTGCSLVWAPPRSGAFPVLHARLGFAPRSSSSCASTACLLATAGYSAVVAYPES